jgi:hypothetical protein
MHHNLQCLPYRLAQGLRNVIAITTVSLFLAKHCVHVASRLFNANQDLTYKVMAPLFQWRTSHANKH